MPLEGERGIAAIIVFVHHFLLAFHPSISGILPGTHSEESLSGSPLFVLINGTGAVFFFFTLSGFVLSWGYFHRPSRYRTLWAALKRWPRLAGPAVLICLASVILFQLQLHWFEEAGSKSGSEWMATFGYSSFHESLPSPGTGIWQGLTTFFTGQAGLNTNLWTMVYEYFGSLIVFAVAPIMVRLTKKAAALLLATLCLLSLAPLDHYPSAITALGFSFAFPFLIGIGVSYIFSRSHLDNRTSLPVAIISCAIGLYLLGYFHPESVYGWAAPLASISPQAPNAVLYSLGSALIIFATMSNGKLFDAMNNRAMRYIGRLSFPLYLVHPLVLASASSWLYINVFVDGGVSLFAATALICLAASVCLARFDEWWIARVNSLFEQIKKTVPNRKTARSAG